MIRGFDFKEFTRTKIFTLIALEVLLIIIFSIWAKAVGNDFLSFKTLITILDSMTLSSFLAIGAGCLLLAGHLDLSQASVGAFAGVMLAAGVKFWHMPLGAIILLSVAVAAGFGLINGILVNKFNFQSFIGTLAMATAIKGLMYFTSVPPAGGAPTGINFVEPSLKAFVGIRLFGVFPITIVLAVGAFIIYGIIMNKTKFGMRVYLVGGNSMAAKFSGINPQLILFILFINCAALSSVSGILGAARLSQGSLLALSTSQFTGLTAAILGGISFGGGRGGLGGTFVGLVILNTFATGMAIININPYWTNAFEGILLLVALSLEYFSLKKTR